MDTKKEILTFIKEQDVKFIRLAFCDLFGMQKNIAILSDQLEVAFEEGISFDGSSIKGFTHVEQSDLLLFPDPSTLSVLPWRPGQGRVVRFFCDIRNIDGTVFVCDTRNLLKEAILRGQRMGYGCKIGTECEFYLFKTDEHGDPTKITVDQGGYFDVAPLDKGENIRREICICLEEMGIRPEASHHEEGPGQNEIDFQYSDILTAADQFLTFKTVVKAVASANGLYASFMPKPLPNQSGSGLHVNLSLYQQGKNMFDTGVPEDVRRAESFIAGILDKVPEITAFLNPISNSYPRFGAFRAPQYISWSRQNRSQLIRIPAASGERRRMELRSPDCSLNPYLAFALLFHAGLDGIEEGLSLAPPLDLNLYQADQTVVGQLKTLPQDLGEALMLADQSAFVARHLDAEVRQRYFREKEGEAGGFNQEGADREVVEEKRYFSLI